MENTSLIDDEKYPHWDLFLGEERKDIEQTWKPWSESILNVYYDKPRELIAQYDAWKAKQPN